MNQRYMSGCAAFLHRKTNGQQLAQIVYATDGNFVDWIMCNIQLQQLMAVVLQAYKQAE